MHNIYRCCRCEAISIRCEAISIRCEAISIKHFDTYNIKVAINKKYFIA